MDIWVSTFWLLWIMLLWTFMYKFCVDVCFHFSWWTPRNGIAGSCGESVYVTLWGHARLFFKSNCIILHFCWQCVKIPISPHPHQHLLLSAFLMTAILVGTKWCLIVVLICISLMTDDEHPFMYLLAICTFLWRNVSLSPLPIFSWVFFFSLLSCEFFIYA